MNNTIKVLEKSIIFDMYMSACACMLIDIYTKDNEKC